MFILSLFAFGLFGLLALAALAATMCNPNNLGAEES